MDNEKIQNKIVDAFEALLAPILGTAYFQQISGVLRQGKSLAAKSVQRSVIWYQHNLPQYVRPLYSLACILTAVTWALGSIVFMVMAPKDAGTWPYWLWTAFDAVLLYMLYGRRYLLGQVMPMAQEDVERLESSPAQIAKSRAQSEAREALGITAPTKAELDAIDALTGSVRDEDINVAAEARENEFGDGSVMTSGTLVLGIMAPFIIGVALWMMASLSNMMGSHWVMTAQFIFVGLLMGYVSLFLVMLLAVSLGTTVRVAGELLIALFKGGWDSVITTVLLNVEGEEAKELLPKDLGKHVGAAWKIFVNVVLSAPGTIALAVIALTINWHHPIEMILISLAFLGLAKSTLFSMQMGNDESPARKRAGKIVALFFWTGFIYRCIEGWYFGWSPGGTWYYTPGSFTSSQSNPPRMVWNMFVPWWNGLVQMNWWQCGLVAAVLVIIINQLVKMPSGKWMNRGKYALIGLCGLGIAIVAVSFIASRASVDAALPTVALVPTPVTGSTVVATAEVPHAPDSIDEMTRTASPPTPPVVAAPVVAPPVVTATAPATTGHRSTVDHPECVGLTPRFLARMQARGLCP